MKSSVFRIAIIGAALTAGAVASAEATEEPTKKVTATEAAEVGDEITYFSQIVCSRNDAFVLWLAGEVAFRQAMRIENSVWTAVDEQRAARKQAMRSLSSCEWTARDLHYRVEKKTIDRQVFYCLRPIANGISSCLWLVENPDTYIPFKKVQQSAETAKKMRAGIFPPPRSLRHAVGTAPPQATPVKHTTAGSRAFREARERDKRLPVAG